MNKSYFLERVLLKRPEALDKYSYEKIPETFHATDKVAITCKKHGLFYQRASTHAAGIGCMQCGVENNAERKRLTTDEFIVKSKRLFGVRYDYSKTIYVKKDVELIITCPEHGDFTITPVQHRWSTTGCLKCDIVNLRAVRKTNALEKARGIHGDKYDYSRVVFTNTTDKVEIVCPEHGSFWQSLYDHSGKKTKCPTCAIDQGRVTKDDFIERSKVIHGDEYDYSQVEFDRLESLVTIVCKKHGRFRQRANSHLQGNKCKKCFHEKSRLTVDEFINNAKQVHGDKYDYSKVVYVGNKTPVEIICPKHGAFWQKPNTHVSSTNGCMLCNESKGERAVEMVLRKYGINFIREYRIYPHLYRYDFYLPGFNIFIEFHGHQHYFPVEIFGGEEEHLRVKERDATKALLVTNHNGKLIVLTYRDLTDGSVEKILIQRLKRVYNHWFVENGQVVAFKTALAVCTAYCLPSTTLVKDIETAAMNARSDVKTLFSESL